jgi:hypothetical protein
MDLAIGLGAPVGNRGCRLAVGLQDNLAKPHLNVVLVAQSAKIFSRLDAGHTNASENPERQLP